MIRTPIIFTAALIMGMAACLAMAQSPRIYVAKQYHDVASGQSDIQQVPVHDDRGRQDFLLETRREANKPLIVPPVPQRREASKYVVLQRATTTVVLDINKRYDSLDESHTWRKAVRLARTRATQPQVRIFRRHDAQAVQAAPVMPKPRAVIRIHPGPAPKRQNQTDQPAPQDQHETDTPRIKVIYLTQFKIAASR